MDQESGFRYAHPVLQVEPRTIRARCAKKALQAYLTAASISLRKGRMSASVVIFTEDLPDSFFYVQLDGGVILW